MANNKSTWISAHLFYDPNIIDGFLVKGVKPFLEKIEKQELVKCFFFIRYRKNGPHIRLRIKPKEGNKEELKNLTETYFKDYFEKFPSNRVLPNDMKEEVNSWYPNNSIQFLEYERTLDRYAGENGMQIAEQHFMLSTKIVLNLLKKLDSYEKKLSYCLFLNMMLMKGFSFSLRESAFFSEFIYESFIPHTFRRSDAFELDKDTRRKYRNDTAKIFEKKYEEQKEKLSRKVIEWWELLVNDEENTNYLFKYWINETNGIYDKYSTALKNNKLIIPTNFENYLTAIINDKDVVEFNNVKLWYIYQSLVHMNNNRLGMWARDEPWIFFILKKSLYKLLKVKNKQL